MASVGCATGGASLGEGFAEAGTLDNAPPQDSGTSLDAGVGDAGHGTDAGADVVVDAPGKDTSTSDTSPTDHATADASAKDTSVPDASVSDIMVVDAPAHECGKPAADSSTTCPSSGFSGALATFDLVGEPGDETSAPVTFVPCGIDSSALSRAAAITAVSGKDSISGSDWSTGLNADATRYYTFTITPSGGCTVTLDSLALDVRASATGPTAGNIATSADGFASHTASFAGTSSGSTLVSATGSGAIEIRVYGWGATGSGGTLRIQNTMTLNGAIL